MPGRRGADFAVDKNLCRRCQFKDPAITIRTEPLCVDCFGRYVSTKIVKRMESFRARHAEARQERKLLLPWSKGASSTVLMHVLSQHLKRQAENSGRTGFKLHVVHVQSGDDEAEGQLREVMERYPDFVYSSRSLSDVLAIDGALCAFPDGPCESIETMFESLPSATSRQDARQVLLRKLVVQHAKGHDCEGILWGDNTTRLAEQTLAETAKGRGFNLPRIVADGESLHGIPFYHPVQDLLRKEVVAYASLVEPTLKSLIIDDPVKPAVSTKNTTIDDLMKQYFESVEQEYPSIVANVVKTSGKLRATPLQQIEQQCELCDAPLEDHAPERSRLCYGCLRILPVAAG